MPSDRHSRVPLIACWALLLASLACTRSGETETSDEHGHSAGAHAEESDSHEHETADGEAGEHDHGEPGHSSHTDAHHVSANETECEDDVTLSAEAMASSDIRVEPARRTILAGMVHAPARVSLRSDTVARIGSPLAGRVVDLPVRLGDRVEAQQVLLVVESPELGQAQADYLQARAEAKALEPAVEIAKSTYERAKELLDSIQGVTLTEVQKRESDFRAADKDLAIARASATAAANRLMLFGLTSEAVGTLEQSGVINPRLEIRAPFAGQVIERKVTLGELVGPEKDSLMVFADTSRLWIMAHVPESRLGEVAEGAEARIGVATLGLVDVPGTVDAIAPTLDTETRNAEVRIEIDNADGRLRPGMFAQALIRGSSRGSVPTLVVPDGAVQTVEGQPAVFVPIDEHGLTFCKHAIEVDEPVDGSIPVRSGLREGELVAVSGTFLLKAEHGKGSAEHEH